MITQPTIWAEQEDMQLLMLFASKFGLQSADTSQAEHC